MKFGLNRSFVKGTPCLAPALHRRVKAFDKAPERVQEFVKGLPEVVENVTQDNFSTLSEVAIDARIEKELLENGFRSTRRTKIICTIGPASQSEEMLEKLMEMGMNVARLNMTHGSHQWHRDVIQKVRAINKRRGFSVAIMVDTEGSEVHTTEAIEPIKLAKGDHFIFTVRTTPDQPKNCLGVSYDAFVDDVQVGDNILVDGGMVSLVVEEKAGPDVLCKCIDPGMVLSRANLTFRRKGHIVRAKNALLPVITAKDWFDIDFAIQERVDFIAVSFVKTSDVIKNLKSYINARSQHNIEVVAKIESYDSLPNLADIIAVSDAIMVARGDLGAQVPIHDVPSVQRDIVMQCRQQSKPVIIASHLLQSMLEFPTPTRAEVADISDMVRQRADAALLSAETAVGRFPDKAVDVLKNCMTRSEEWVRQEKFGKLDLPYTADTVDGKVSDQLCRSATDLANNLGAAAIFVYTRRGYMARFLSRYRPDSPIFAFTPDNTIRRKLNLCWGVMPFKLDFSEDPEENVERTFRLMLTRGLVRPGDLVIVLSDLGLTRQGQTITREGAVRSIQVRRIPLAESAPDAAGAAAAVASTPSASADNVSVGVLMDGKTRSLKDWLLEKEKEKTASDQLKEKEKEKKSAAAAAAAPVEAAAPAAKEGTSNGKPAKGDTPKAK